MKVKKVCIFCNKERKLSKEHLWPDWLKNYVDIKPSDKHINEIHSGAATKRASVEKRLERNGNVIAVKFRVVCQPCNNEWMSEIERKVEHFFKLAMANDIKNIDKTLQRNLAEWIALKTMVAEQSDGKTQVTPTSDLKRFYDTRHIPDYYRIYIGKHNLKSITEYMRHSCTISLDLKGPTQGLNGLSRNTQSFALIFGSVLIYLVACREKDISIHQRLKLNELKVIFPYKKVVDWNTVKALRPHRVTDIAHSLPDLINSDKVLFGGNAHLTGFGSDSN